MSGITNNKIRVLILGGNDMINTYGTVYAKIRLSKDNNSFIYLKGSEGTLESTDYSIKTNTEVEELEITFNIDIEDNIEVLIIRDGYIVSDLSLDEVYILSLCMRLFWLNPKIHREENLRQMMNDRDFNQLSNANMLKALLQLHKSTRQELQKFKQRYCFNGFEGFE